MSTPKDGFCNAGAGHEGTRNAHNSKYPSPEAHLHAMPGAYFNKFLAVTFSYFTYGYAAYIFFTWFFIYLRTVRGLNLRDSSFYTMLPFLAMASCSLAGGWASDRLTKRYGKRTGRCGLAVF